MPPKTQIEDIIEERHITADKLQGRTMYEGHIVADLARLVEEVRYLRATLRRVQPLRSFDHF